MTAQRPVNVDCTDEHGQTALMKAARHGHDRIVRILVKNSRNLRILCHQGWGAPHYAAYGGHTTSLRYMLTPHGGDPDAKDLRTHYDETPLMIAACYGHVDAVNYLVDQKASVLVTDWRGRTALDYACIMVERVQREIMAGGSLSSPDESAATEHSNRHNDGLQHPNQQQPSSPQEQDVQEHRPDRPAASPLSESHSTQHQLGANHAQRVRLHKAYARIVHKLIGAVSATGIRTIVREYHMTDTCHKCGRKGEMALCPTCMLVWYCSRNCQRNGDAGHRQVCALVWEVRQAIATLTNETTETRRRLAAAHRVLAHFKLARECNVIYALCEALLARCVNISLGPDITVVDLNAPDASGAHGHGLSSSQQQQKHRDQAKGDAIILAVLRALVTADPCIPEYSGIHVPSALQLVESGGIEAMLRIVTSPALSHEDIVAIYQCIATIVREPFVMSAVSERLESIFPNLFMWDTLLTPPRLERVLLSLCHEFLARLCIKGDMAMDSACDIVYQFDLEEMMRMAKLGVQSSLELLTCLCSWEDSLDAMYEADKMPEAIMDTFLTLLETVKTDVEAEEEKLDALPVEQTPAASAALQGTRLSRVEQFNLEWLDEACSAVPDAPDSEAKGDGTLSSKKKKKKKKKRTPSREGSHGTDTAEDWDDPESSPVPLVVAEAKSSNLLKEAKRMSTRSGDRALNRRLARLAVALHGLVQTLPHSDGLLPIWLMRSPTPLFGSLSILLRHSPAVLNGLVFGVENTKNVAKFMSMCLSDVYTTACLFGSGHLEPTLAGSVVEVLQLMGSRVVVAEDPATVQMIGVALEAAVKYLANHGPLASFLGESSTESESEPEDQRSAQAVAVDRRLQMATVLVTKLRQQTLENGQLPESQAPTKQVAPSRNVKLQILPLLEKAKKRAATQFSLGLAQGWKEALAAAGTPSQEATSVDGPLTEVDELSIDLLEGDEDDDELDDYELEEDVWDQPDLIWTPDGFVEDYSKTASRKGVRQALEQMYGQGVSLDELRDELLAELGRSHSAQQFSRRFPPAAFPPMNRPASQVPSTATAQNPAQDTKSKAAALPIDVKVPDAPESFEEADSVSRQHTASSTPNQSNLQRIPDINGGSRRRTRASHAVSDSQAQASQVDADESGEFDRLGAFEYHSDSADDQDDVMRHGDDSLSGSDIDDGSAYDARDVVLNSVLDTLRMVIADDAATSARPIRRQPTESGGPIDGGAADQAEGGSASEPRASLHADGGDDSPLDTVNIDPLLHTIQNQIRTMREWKNSLTQPNGQTSDQTSHAAAYGLNAVSSLESTSATDVKDESFGRSDDLDRVRSETWSLLGDAASEWLNRRFAEIVYELDHRSSQHGLAEPMRARANGQYTPASSKTRGGDSNARQQSSQQAHAS